MLPSGVINDDDKAIRFYLEVFSDNCLSKYIIIVWFEAGLLSLSLFCNQNFGLVLAVTAGKYGFKTGLKPKLKRLNRFLVSNQGFKLWF